MNKKIDYKNAILAISYILIGSGICYLASFSNNTIISALGLSIGLMVLIGLGSHHYFSIGQNAECDNHEKEKKDE